MSKISKPRTSRGKKKQRLKKPSSDGGSQQSGRLRPPARRRKKPLDVKNIPTRWYRKKGGSASRRVNDAMAAYRKFRETADVDSNAGRREVRKQLDELERLLGQVTNPDKRDAVALVREALVAEGTELNIARKNQILREYAIEGPKIVFRYDSRPIDVALQDGYVAQDPENATITERGENQSMVGGARNFVGSLNYKGYANRNADPRTKKKWEREGGHTYYWTAAIVREGGMTYEWLLDQIPNETDRDRARELVLEREEGTEKDDEELKGILDKHGVSRNIGTTEIVTDRIAPEDILGYWEIFEPTDRLEEKQVRWRSVREFDEKRDDGIPEEDLARYSSFQETGGSVTKSRIM
uniref:Uncharacterized protein n=1 Tax=Candidatus Kentrum sp. UNK TaxID=2126344 RepID=A0A451AY21_9GAMM|nr:MAG: hypothetical protein BECKUNK1418G_GA0071005_10382 [Candidatus Kentron sp. UNK]VFK70941.1 MAG: hypothetical protein BECKUNK1418H_GA0071006_10442 [Candidatus Kentron sp. UNK]